ncbi:carboxylesterase family protein [Sphingomonas sp. ASV193]|uniref:carboxylesterase/lipase family protein n=1 Tax=Sphingomonas sp. ASV193 TaxID=3144405 RepID=UPI0032E91F56
MIKRLLAFALLAANPGQAQLQPASVVRTEGGPVGGAPFDGGYVFRGIPFAAPPTGPLRWKPPQPPTPWRSVRASQPQPASCLQNDYGWNRGDVVIGSEDCLTLDVRTPALVGHRPVLVWIHGGSNLAGGPNDIVLSDVGEKVVIVGVRYRLGLFGFLAHRGAAAEAGGHAGNYGLMDQAAALGWVRRNIARFGGDPDQVTIAGESAGAQDVSLMLAAPSTRGLFRRAIVESGTPGFGLPPRPLAEALRLGDQLDAAMGSGGSIDKLRAMSATALLAADRTLHDDALESDDYRFLRVTIDGAYLPDDPAALLARAGQPDVLIGSNRVELNLPGDRPHRDAFVAKATGPRETAARAYYRLDEPDPPVDPRLGERDQIIATDLTFRCPTVHLATLLARRGQRVWHYEFDAAPGGGRTTHAREISYAFGADQYAPGQSLKPYWLNFIMTGDPNGPGLATWPRFDPGAQQHLLFDSGGAHVEGPLRPEACALNARL